MKAIVKTTVIAIISFMATTVEAQESTKPEDFGLPKNTEIAQEMTGLYYGEKHSFTQTGIQEYRFNSKGQIIQSNKKITDSIAIQNTYHYDDQGNLAKIDYVFGAMSGALSSSTSTFSIEKESYKTTYKHKNHNGYSSITIAFYNEAGELRGKSFYNTKNELVKKIEYNGTNEYRVKELKDNKTVSDIIHENNEQGRLVKQLKFIKPMEKASKEELTTYSYNDKGDIEKMVVHYDNEPGKTPVVMNTYTTEYLYDGDIWVASIRYRDLYYNKPSSVEVTVRSINTAGKIYTVKDEKNLLDFCKQVYQHYLATKK